MPKIDKGYYITLLDRGAATMPPSCWERRPRVSNLVGCSWQAVRHYLEAEETVQACRGCLQGIRQPLGVEVRPFLAAFEVLLHGRKGGDLYVRADLMLTRFEAICSLVPHVEGFLVEGFVEAMQLYMHCFKGKVKAALDILEADIHLYDRLVQTVCRLGPQPGEATMEGLRDMRGRLEGKLQSLLSYI
jgi:hypothetical protein